MPYCRNCGNQLEEADKFCQTCGTARKGASSKTSFTGKTCPFCQFPIKQDSETVLCSSCKIPHHRECWQENGGCTTFGCRGLSEGLHNYRGIEPAFIATLDADYFIDFAGGTISIGDLPIGTRVIDPSWKWDFRTGSQYTRKTGDETSPVTWLIVAKDHYKNFDQHVTLLSEKPIGRFSFDNSTDRKHALAEYGYNHWGESGTGNATCGLRPWLNSSGIHSSEGFYQVFSEDFKRAMLTTTVPNKEWKNGSSYSTSDEVFIPSTTELGDTEHDKTYPIGSVYPYFQGTGYANRVARLGGRTKWYWTRSPASSYGALVRYVHSAGVFGYVHSSSDGYGVRPALNLKSETLVS